MTTIDIPSRPVNAYYGFVPGKDELVHGSKLQEGMIVLIEGNLVRSNGTKKSNTGEYDRRRFLETRYWCMVTELKTTNSNRDVLQFVGVYADGAKRVRTYNKDYYWIVLKDSIPS